MIWWAEQPGRARDEQVAIGELAELHTWLTIVKTRLNEQFSLVFDFNLEIDDKVIPLSLRYPELFPDAAPSVFSRDGQRLSGHQYGPQGELCLEYRPDNWTTDITGAMMIESAHRLLSTEQETGRPAPSDHQISRSQRYRHSTLRFFYSAETLAGLSKIELGNFAEAEIHEQVTAQTFVAELYSIGPAVAPIWESSAKRGGETRPIASVAIRIPEKLNRPCKDLAELRALLWSNGFGNFVTELVNDTEMKLVVLFDGERPHVGIVFSGDDERKLIKYEAIFTEPDHQRLDSEYHNLKSAKVAIVGCGSVGSKIAVQLARSEVTNFVLIDGDILASGNLVRNELDWRSVGVHKAPALGSRLNEINPNCVVDARTNPVGGQESGASASATIAALAACDLIIDATAEPNVFDFCGAIARRFERPLFWAQVFGGGVGGVVARLRPGIEPPPLVARQRIEAWYRDQGVPWPDDGPSKPYSDHADDGRPLVADDADVTVIASHLSRFIIDYLSRPEASQFPYSTYVIGLKEKWIFSAPFDVRPVDLGEGDQWGEKTNAADKEALEAFLSELLASDDDEG